MLSAETCTPSKLYAHGLRVSSSDLFSLLCTRYLYWDTQENILIESQSLLDSSLRPRQILSADNYSSAWMVSGSFVKAASAQLLST
ncbi:hypothetical protein V6N13_052195 [Hibiscus sabdariffa]